MNWNIFQRPGPVFLGRWLKAAMEISTKDLASLRPTQMTQSILKYLIYKLQNKHIMINYDNILCIYIYISN